MRIPVIKGRIKRRLLVNFRADPAVVQRILPQPFRPKLHRGRAVVGICLIRLHLGARRVGSSIRPLEQHTRELPILIYEILRDDSVRANPPNNETERG